MQRPMKLLDFIFTFQPVADLHYRNHEFNFPLVVVEDGSLAALLVPIPAAKAVFANLDELMPRIVSECAYVAVPYHPPEDEDDSIYSFGVHMLHIDNETPAIGETLIIQQYARRLWAKYRRLETDVSE